VLKRAKGFGMHVVVSNRTQDQNLANEMGFEYKTLDELLTLSDIITLHLPDCQETHHTINKLNIVKVKKGAYIVNTARGGLIDTEALVTALENGTLAGVGLDVLEEENELCEEAEILTPTYREKVDMKTLILDHVLMNHPHVIITPHNAFNSKEALDRITHTTIENIQSFQAGTPKNTVAKRP
jgi:D-lactate dehydrogenase